HSIPIGVRRKQQRLPSSDLIGNAPASSGSFVIADFCAVAFPMKAYHNMARTLRFALYVTDLKEFS
ncbi:MAG: hypothetical protein LAP85_25985, partial [Acidobacteriia bacterium]|nr:hypothetical protein [Terriglobia bacterium]